MVWGPPPMPFLSHVAINKAAVCSIKRALICFICSSQFACLQPRLMCNVQSVWRVKRGHGWLHATASIEWVGRWG